MEYKYALGDRVRVVQRYMDQVVGDEGTIVSRRRDGVNPINGRVVPCTHPYGVLFDKKRVWHHSLSCNTHRVESFSREYFTGGIDYIYLQSLSFGNNGYSMPEHCLALAEVAYDPSQQGDTDEDI